MFESFFDFDGDGEASTMELASGFALAACIMDEEREDELRDDLAIAGLDEFELSMMDSDERDSLLEENGLDPFDYEDLFEA